MEQHMNKSLSLLPSSPPIDVCPVTSLPVETWPEWTEVRLTDTYAISFSIIGGTILHNQPSGRVDDPGTAAAFKARERFIRESGLIDKRFVEIRDYERLKGFPSKRGRLLVADALLVDINAGRLLGFWIYNAQLLIQSMFNVGAKINRVPIPTGAFRDYGSAMETALRVLAGAGVGVATVSRPGLLQPTKEWRLEMQGYGVCFRLADRDVLYAEVHGVLTEESVDSLFELLEQCLQESGLAAKGHYYRVIDCAKISGFTWSGRKQYVRKARELQGIIPCRGYLLFGLTRVTRGLLALVKPFAPCPVLPARDFDHAMELIRHLRVKEAQDRRKAGDGGNLERVFSEQEVRGYADEVLDYIGVINWDKPEVETRNVGDEHLFKHVFDAVAVVKGDVSDLLEERRRAEKVLQESEEKYRTIFENAVEGIFQSTPEGRFITANKALVALLGYDSREDLEANVTDIKKQVYFNPDDRDAFVRELTQKDRVQGFKTQFRRKDGSLVWVELSARILKGRNGSPVYEGTVQDITPRLEREEAETRRQAAEAASRAKSDFLANMSHEIRTPLNAIMGMAELSLEGDPANVHRESYQTIYREAESLLNIINHVLDFSKIEAGQLELDRIDFDVRAVMDHVADGIAFLAETKGVEYISYIAPGVPPRLSGDPGRLRQVLLNLAGNALKFTHSGEIFVGVDVVKDGSLERTAGNDPLHDSQTVRLCFTVRDTGVGIPKDKQSVIFESFTQADGSTTRQYGGTGLGLAISKRFVELMGGTIEVQSEPDQGSTFWFIAPFGDQPAEEAHGMARADLEGVRALIVDDNETSRLILSEYLSSWGCVTCNAGSAFEALKVLLEADKDGQPIQLLLSDVQMPGMSGYDLAVEIRRRESLEDAAHLQNKPAIILLSSSGMRGEWKRGAQVGVEGYLSKPVRREELRGVMETVLGAVKRSIPLATPVTRHSLVEDAVRQRERHSEANAREGVRILLVEDYPTNRQVAMRHLTNVGYEVDLAENGLQAVKAFQQAAYDVILMDIQMPVMDGYEATRRIRAAEVHGSRFSGSTVKEMADDGADVGATRGRPLAGLPNATHPDSTPPQTVNREPLNREPKIPIIAMTAHAIKGYREQCLEAGMDDYITKPVRRADLLAMLEKWTRGVRTEDVFHKPFDVSQVRDDPMDYVRAVEEFEGDEDFLREVIQGFLDAVDGQLRVLEQSLAEGDAETVAREAHAIKGGAANLTADALAGAARELENLGRSNVLEKGLETLADLEREYGRLKAYIGAR
jgi:PAS domain S-box-containing protein